MLEPLFACNLRCEGCGRIREYASFRNRMMNVEECLQAARECGAPIVSICGGEPLLYPHLDELVQGLIDQNRAIYLCTNALLMPLWLQRLPCSPLLTWNVHLDGMEATHDAITGRPGTFREVTHHIAEAKRRKMRVTTNTTIYAQTDMHEILVLLEYLEELGVDGMLLSPAFPYESASHARFPSTEKTTPSGSGDRRGNSDALACCGSLKASPQEAAQAPLGHANHNPSHVTPHEHGLFLDREQVRVKFASIEKELRRFPLINSPLYLDFLVGRRELPCAAWASPTRNVCGWKSPCYLITDTHFETFHEWQTKTPWQSLGPEHDERCRNCLVHYGFEPAALLAAQRSIRDALCLAHWHLARRR